MKAASRDYIHKPTYNHDHRSPCLPPDAQPQTDQRPPFPPSSLHLHLHHTANNQNGTDAPLNLNVPRLATEISSATDTRESQVELREHIDNLATELCRINEHQKVALDLDPYVKKLLNARRRVVLVNNILQNAQERLRRLNHNVAKETARRKTMLEASGVFTTRSPSKP
ncbi:SNARE-associated protein [Collichthys lucidus]|uniref:Biogenesis of lysosome-related organelles complex 1 subunit 7 n=1 Tax=Collichthys lucidus TaxID=240159 RepID=A0A4U5VJY1_COLLU|nr:SNARE-associated protein [Collichthys lucidus]